MTQTTQTQSGGLPEVFNYNDKPVRTTIKDNEPWFCMADVGAVLGLKNYREFTKSEWCEQEGVETFYTPTEGGVQPMTFISEPNLYAVVMRSTKPEAKAFSRWVTHEVLPSLRKHGSFVTAHAAGTDPFLANLEQIRTLYINQQEIARRQSDVENRLGKIEHARELAQEALDALPAPVAELRELSTRERCRQAIDALASASGIVHQDCWRKAYAEYDYQKRTKLTVLAANAKMDKLEYVEKRGDIDALYSIIKRLTDNARRAS